MLSFCDKRKNAVFQEINTVFGQIQGQFTAILLSETESRLAERVQNTGQNMSIRPSFRSGIFVLTEPVEIQAQVSEEHGPKPQF
jgi:hypothetical protein